MLLSSAGGIPGRGNHASRWCTFRWPTGALSDGRLQRQRQPPLPSPSRRPLHRCSHPPRRDDWPRSPCSDSPRLRDHAGRTAARNLSDRDRESPRGDPLPHHGSYGSRNQRFGCHKQRVARRITPAERVNQLSGSAAHTVPFRLKRHGPLRVLPTAIAQRRATPRAMRFRTRVRGSCHCFPACPRIPASYPPTGPAGPGLRCTLGPRMDLRLPLRSLHRDTVALSLPSSSPNWDRTNSLIRTSPKVILECMFWFWYAREAHLQTAGLARHTTSKWSVRLRRPTFAALDDR